MARWRMLHLTNPAQESNIKVYVSTTQPRTAPLAKNCSVLTKDFASMREKKKKGKKETNGSFKISSIEQLTTSEVLLEIFPYSVLEWVFFHFKCYPLYFAQQKVVLAILMAKYHEKKNLFTFSLPGKCCTKSFSSIKIFRSHRTWLLSHGFLNMHVCYENNSLIVGNLFIVESHTAKYSSLTVNGLKANQAWKIKGMEQMILWRNKSTI